jgi:hypothetical protein
MGGPFSDRGLWRFVLAVVAALAALLVLQSSAGTHNAELSGYPDEASHYVTGLMAREYALGGWKDGAPLPFAERYYLHYPKVAFGHWPPVYYLVQFFWSLPFSFSMSSILLLQAVLLAIIAAGLFTLIDARYGWAPAVAATGVFLLLPATQELNILVMSEPLLTLLSSAATWFLARYFTRREIRDLIAFAILAELAALTKGSGIALFGLPTGLAICLRDWRFFRTGQFWLLHLFLFGILIPWQLLTWDMARNGMEAAVTWEWLLKKGESFALLLPLMLGWPLVVGLVVGMLLLLWRDKDHDALPLACAVMVAGAWLFHWISPTGVEYRRLYMAVPAMLLLAAAGLAHIGRVLKPKALSWALPFLVAGVSLAAVFEHVEKPQTGHRATARWILQQTDGREQAILTTSQNFGEGILIAEIAQAEPKPAVFLVRASKLLSDSDWNGADYRLVVSDPAEIRATLDSIPTRFLVTDRYEGESGPPHHDLLHRLLTENPGEWILRHRQPSRSPQTRRPGEILVYERLNLPHTQTVSLRIDLRRMLGRFVTR